MEALRWLLAPNPSPMTLDGTRTYVVGREEPAVIDPGPADAGHVARLRELLGAAAPVAILVTHHHPDHAGAAPALAAATGAPIMMGRGALDIGFPPVRADRGIGDGDAIETDAGVIHAVATPGHAPEHLAFSWSGRDAPAGGALFVGDLMMGEGDTALVAPPEGELRSYLASLERVRAAAPGVLLPAHGPPLRDPAEAVERYLRHRHERVEQVLDALARGGPAAAAELVERVYGADLDPRLRPAAEGSLRAILRLLEEEARVRRSAGGGYAPAGGAARASGDDVEPSTEG